MQYYIKEWSDQSASLIAEDGYFLDTFESIEHAIDACLYDCLVEPEHIETYNNQPGIPLPEFNLSYI